MKKTIIAWVCGALLLSSCATTGEGAVVGAQFGTILGSVIGGISGGHRGHDLGAVVGMAGGAAVGAAIGHSAEKKSEVSGQRPTTTSQQPTVSSQQPATTDSQAQGDDRIDFDVPGPNGEKAGSVAARHDAEHGSFRVQGQVELRNLRILEGDQDGILHAGEQCKVVFELMNRTPKTLYNVCPKVTATTHNKHLFISPDMCVESIAPGTGVRYTATVQADRKLKDGEVLIHIGVSVNNRELTSQSREITLRTSRH